MHGFIFVVIYIFPHHLPKLGRFNANFLVYQNVASQTCGGLE